MDLIKEYQPKNRTVIIRTRTYTDSLAHIQTLADALCGDFPFLNREDIKIRLYSGKAYAHTFGVEAVLPLGTHVPDSYAEVMFLESHY